jgi:DNA primase small subunit
VHPGTGRVCVPIDTRALDEFDPFGVPTVLELLSEIDDWEEANGNQPVASAEGEKKVADWEKTSLKPYVEYFKGFVAGLLKDEKAAKRDRDDGGGESMEF